MSYYRNPPPRDPRLPTMGLPAVTPVNRALMIACGVVWLVQILCGPVLEWQDLSRVLGLVPRAVAGGAVWQPFTYLFLHSPWMPSHILLNMLMLWMIGGDLERHWGGRRYLAYYLTCGVGAGLFVAAVGLARNPQGVTIGASGAIFGLLLAYGTIFSERIIYLMMVFPVRAKILVLILGGIEFFSLFGQAPDGVSHVAHLSGIAVGWIYLRKPWRLSALWRELRWKWQRRKFRVMPPDDRDRWVH